jgi:hypothetical protein
VTARDPEPLTAEEEAEDAAVRAGRLPDLDEKIRNAPADSFLAWFRDGGEPGE